jgi:hypothetical protein
MSLKTYLDEVSSPRASSSVNLEASKLRIVATELADSYGFAPAEAPHPADIRIVYQKLISILHGAESFQKISVKEWKLVPWALVRAVDGNEPLFEVNKAASTILSYVRDNSKYRAVQPLLNVFLMEYPYSSPSFDDLRESAKSLLINHSLQQLASVKAWLVTNQVMENNAADLSAKRALLMGLPDLFNQLRLNKGLEFGRFAELIVQKLLTKLSYFVGNSSSDEQLKTINSLLKFLVNDDGEIKYSSLRIDIADGLLQPFQVAKPTKKLKKLLKGFFLLHYGDPRIKKGLWVGVSEEAISIFRSWMVEDTMLDFFKLLSHVAKTDATADKHWIYRKRFWNAYLQQGHIAEAWVALGPIAKSAAKEFIGSKGSYASLSGGLRSHSVLIMKIGSLIITEWSHTGKFRVWDTNSSAPVLYKRAYDRGNLVYGFDYEGAHSGSENGSWQYKLSQRIKDYSRLNVSHREYMND